MFKVADMEDGDDELDISIMADTVYGIEAAGLAVGALLSRSLRKKYVHVVKQKQQHSERGVQDVDREHHS